MSAAARRFARKLAILYPHLSPEDIETRLVQFCEVGMASARAFSITTEFHVFSLIVSMSILGTRYPDDPAFKWARDTLESPGMPEQDKMGLLRLRILIDTSRDIFIHG